MDTPQLKIHAARDFSRQGTSLYVLDGRSIGYLTFIPFEPGGSLIPTTTLNDAQAQYLMDQFWDAGIRPSEGIGSAGQAAAMQAHINSLDYVVKELLKP